MQDSSVESTNNRYSQDLESRSFPAVAMAESSKFDQTWHFASASESSAWISPFCLLQVTLKHTSKTWLAAAAASESYYRDLSAGWVCSNHCISPSSDIPLL